MNNGEKKNPEDWECFILTVNLIEKITYGRTRSRT